MVFGHFLIDALQNACQDAGKDGFFFIYLMKTEMPNASTRQQSRFFSLVLEKQTPFLNYYYYYYLVESTSATCIYTLVNKLTLK